MSVRIRLARIGAKKKPYYRIVIADSRCSRDGRRLEVVGHYDPKQGMEKADLKSERVRHWLGCGARPTDIVRQILKVKLSAQAA